MKLHEMRKFIKEKWDDKFFVLEKNRVGHFVLYCEEHDRKWMVTKAKLLAGKGDCVLCRPEGPPKPKPMLPHSVYVDRIKALHPSFEVIGKYNGVMRNCAHRCKLCGFEWEATPNNVQKRYYKCPSCLNQGLKLTKQQKKAAKEVVLDGRKERYELIRQDNKQDKAEVLEQSKLKEIEFRLDNGMDIPYYLKETYRKHFGTRLEDLDPAEEDFDPEAPVAIEQPDAPDWDSDSVQDWTPVVRVKDTAARVVAFGAQPLEVQVVELDIVEDDEPEDQEVDLVQIEPDEPSPKVGRLFGESELELSDEDDDPDTYMARRVEQCAGCLDMKRQPWRVECEVCGKRR